MIRLGSVLLVLAVAGCATPQKSRTVGGDALAQDFRGNTVVIRTEWADGTRHEGIGFIVGASNGRAYIATADHVLRDTDKPREAAMAQTIDTFFFGQLDRPYPGRLLGISDRRHDVGAIEAEMPEGLSWRKDVIAPERAQRGTQVRFVGKAGRWTVPVNPGVVSGPDPPWFLVEGLQARRGSSGAPLLSDLGLVGMVVEGDNVDGTRSLPIQIVEDIFKPRGLPWQLTARREERQAGVPTWIKIAGGVLGAVAIGSAMAGSDGGSDGESGAGSDGGCSSANGCTVTIQIPLPQ